MMQTLSIAKERTTPYACEVVHPDLTHTLAVRHWAYVTRGIEYGGELRYPRWESIELMEVMYGATFMEQMIMRNFIKPYHN